MTRPTVAYNVPSRLPDQRTILVTGHFRGGTSMVAGILRMLGLFLGDRIERGNNEDLEFKDAPVSAIRARIRERDAAHHVWGFKYPGVFLTGAEWIDEVRNPIVVCIMRDLLACAQSEVFNRQFADELDALRSKCDHQTKLMQFLEVVKARRRPFMLISYERALQHPRDVVDSLAAFAGLDAPEETRRNAADFVTPERGHADPEANPYVSLEFVLASRLRDELRAAGRGPSSPAGRT